MLCPPMSSPPFAFGRPSSPLNPYSDRSSSPIASSSSRILGPSSPTPMSSHRTRYKRPEQKKYLASAPAELFSEGTTPIEGQMWRETFSRRIQERERRKQSRDDKVDKRRASTGRYDEDEEEKARKDDEEIFRRLMVEQRRKAQRAADLAYEQDNGGSDPISPDFWDEQEHQAMVQAMSQIETNAVRGELATPQARQLRPLIVVSAQPRGPRSASDVAGMDQDDDIWGIEAARAEEAEREAEAEEAELARQIEEAQQVGTAIEVQDMDVDIDMDWDMDSQ